MEPFVAPYKIQFQSTGKKNSRKRDRFATFGQISLTLLQTSLYVSKYIVSELTFFILCFICKFLVRDYIVEVSLKNVR